MSSAVPPKLVFVRKLATSADVSSVSDSCPAGGGGGGGGGGGAAGGTIATDGVAMGAELPPQATNMITVIEEAMRRKILFLDPIDLGWLNIDETPRFD